MSTRSRNDNGSKSVEVTLSGSATSLNELGGPVGYYHDMMTGSVLVEVEIRREAMMSNVQTAKDLYAAFGRGEIPTVLAMFHPEIQWREAEGNPYQPDGAPWVGPQEILEKLFMRIGSEWDGFTVSVRVLHDAGEHVVTEGRYTGTYKPSGKNIDAQMCHVLRFRDGKLLSFQQYADTGQLQAAMTTR